MAGIFDFLGNLAPVLGPAARGYTGGLAQGEQAKINLLRQQQNDQANQSFRSEQLDLQRLKMQQDAERALKEGQDRLRELSVRAATESLKMYSDPQFRADHDFQAEKAGLETSTQVQAKIVKWLQDTMAGKEPGEFPYPKAIQRIQTMEGTQPPVPGQPQAPPSRDDGQVSMTAEQLQQMLTQAPIAGPAIGALPEQVIRDQFFNGAEGASPQNEIVASRPPAAPPGFVPQPPKTAAEIGFKKAQTRKQGTGADLDESRTAKTDAETKYVGPLAESLIAQRGASARYSDAAAAELPGKAARDQQRISEQTRANREREKLDRERLERQKAMDGVDAAYKRAQTKKTLADWQKVKDGLGKVAKTTQLDAADKAEYEYLKKNATSTSKITGKIQPTPGYNERMEKFLKKVREKYGKGAEPANEETTTAPAAPTTPTKLTDFYPDDVAEVKRNLRNFDAWVNTLSPEVQETAKAIRGMMR